MMGTFVEVASPYQDALKIAFDEMSRIEALLSKYDPKSEISRLNKTGKITASRETIYIVKKSIEFWKKTGGAFDITVGPWVSLWGFTNKHYRLPSKVEITSVLKHVGSDKIVLDEGKNVIQFKLQDMSVDLGAIAKGYAVDCAVAKLKEKGIDSCIINAGGQIYCLGKKYGKPWKVAIQNPRKGNFLGTLNLVNKAVSTSGDYEQYFIRGNKRYSHIFDPHTGFPVATNIVSVTVVAEDGLTADALSTSIFILGKSKGEVLASQFSGVQVKVIELVNKRKSGR